MTIKEVLETCPKAEKVLKKHLGFCVGCPSAHLETLALGAHLHEKDVREIVGELNEALKKPKTKNTKHKK